MKDFFSYYLWGIGRLNRRKYFNVCISIILLFVYIVINGDFINPFFASIINNNGILSFLGLIYNSILFISFIISFYIFLVMSIKRFHDMNDSGGHIIMLFIPLLNIIFFLVLLLKKGTLGTNKYGQDLL